MQPAGFRSIRWQLPLTYALIALISAVALGVLLVGLLRQYYWQQEYTLLDNMSMVLSRQLGVRLNGPLTQETLALGEIPAFRFAPNYRIELLDPAGETVFDTGLLNSITIEFARPAPAESVMALETASLEPVWSADPIMLPQAVPDEQVLWTEAGTIQTFGATASSGGAQVTSPFYDLSIRPVTGGGGTALASAVLPVQDGVTWAVGSDGTSGNFYISPDDFEAATLFYSVRSNASTTRMVTNPDGRLFGFVRLSNPPAIGSALIESVTSGAIVAGTGAILIAAIVGWWVSLRLTRPVLALSQATARMIQGDLAARVDVRRHDELGELADSFNAMAGKVEATVAALRRFAADAAHELHTPLTAIRTNLELTRERPDAARLTEAVAQIARLEALADDLLDLSRLEVAEAPRQETVDVGALVREVSEVYASRAEQAGVDFALNVGDTLPPVTANASLLRRALGNLLDNAVKFTPAGGDVSLTTRSEGGRLAFVVEDSGIGVPSDDLPVLFSRFHRGSNTADYPGSGLGLAIVKAIADVHQGSVQAENTPKGARFVLHLPAAASV